jgi:hypothetical protein
MGAAKRSALADQSTLHGKTSPLKFFAEIRQPADDLRRPNVAESGW